MPGPSRGRVNVAAPARRGERGGSVQAPIAARSGDQAADAEVEHAGPLTSARIAPRAIRSEWTVADPSDRGNRSGRAAGVAGRAPEPARCAAVVAAGVAGARSASPAPPEPPRPSSAGPAFSFAAAEPPSTAAVPRTGRAGGRRPRSVLRRVGGRLRRPGSSPGSRRPRGSRWRRSRRTRVRRSRSPPLRRWRGRAASSSPRRRRAGRGGSSR